MDSMHKCNAAVVTLLFLALPGTGAPAQTAAPGTTQNYPVKSIRLIVPFPAGASSDVVGRMLGQKISERLGEQVVADNRAGAGGNLGIGIVAKSAPDGYTIRHAPRTDRRESHFPRAIHPKRFIALSTKKLPAARP